MKSLLLDDGVLGNDCDLPNGCGRACALLLLLGSMASTVVARVLTRGRFGRLSCRRKGCARCVTTAVAIFGRGDGMRLPYAMVCVVVGRKARVSPPSDLGLRGHAVEHGLTFGGRRGSGSEMRSRGDTSSN